MIREKQIKTTMRFNYTPTRMAKIKRKVNVGEEDMAQLKLPYTADGNLNGTTIWENRLAVSYKVKYILTI